MGNINVLQQITANVDSFDKNNMQTVLTRMNEYLQKADISIEVTKIRKVSDIDLKDPIITAFQYSNININITSIMAYEQSVNNSNSKASVDVTVAYSKILE